MTAILSPLDMAVETSQTTGNNPLELDGAVDGFRTLVAAAVDGNSCYLGVRHKTAAEWLTGWFTVASGSPNTVTLVQPVLSSNSNAAVSWSAGEKLVYTIAPPEGRRALWHPDDAPPVPSAFDDHFTTPSLDAKWTEVVSPDGTSTKLFNKFGTMWGMDHPGGAASRYAIRQTITKAGGDFAVTVKCHLGSAEGISRVFVNVGDNATLETGTYFSLLAQSQGTGEPEVAIAAQDDASMALLEYAPVGLPIYLHFRRNGSNNLKCYVSSDGTTFRRMGSVSKTITATYFSLVMDGESSARGTRTLVDSVLFDDPRFTQPI